MFNFFHLSVYLSTRITPVKETWFHFSGVALKIFFKTPYLYIYISLKIFCEWLLTRNINQSLFGKQFYSSMFHNIFYYTQLAFVFRLQEEFYIIHKYIVIFFIFLFFGKILISLTSFFLSRSFVLVIVSWWIFRHHIMRKNLYKKLMFQ